MAQFRTTADILNSVLERAGETTSGTSSYETRALNYLNRINHAIISGGNEFNIEVDEPWVWARRSMPMVMELQPAYETGTVSLTLGSEAGSFSAAVTDSLQGWHLQLNGRDGLFKIVTHAAGGTAFELDGNYDGATGATLTYKAIKLEYELVDTYLIIDNTNNKMDFEETSSSELTATLTNGSYTPAELATEIDTQLTSVGASAYTVSYDSITRKFTLVSDLAGGGNTFKLLCATGTNQAKSAWKLLGYDDDDQVTAGSHTSVYVLSGINRLIEPILIYKANYNNDFVSNISGIDINRFNREYPGNRVLEGVPTKFAKIDETNDGRVVVRFNKYVSDVTRIEVPFIPVPRDLFDNAVSSPIIPRKYVDALEFGAASDILFEKEDSKWEGYMQKAGAKLNAMALQNRNQLQRIGKNFAQVIAREDMLIRRRRYLRYGEPDGQ